MQIYQKYLYTYIIAYRCISAYRTVTNSTILQTRLVVMDTHFYFLIELR